MSNEKEIRISIVQEDKIDIGTKKETKISLGVEQDNIDIKMSKEENVEVEFETKEIITTRDHSKLDNLEFEKSGHIGFASSKDLVELEQDIPEKVIETIKDNGEETQALEMEQTTELDVVEAIEINVGTSQQYDEESDKEVATTKLVKELVNKHAVPKRLSVLPIVNENAERDKVYLYADENGTSKRISMRNMLDTKIRTVNGIPINLQPNEYIFNEIE